ncbi:MAG TPA: type I-U CRISPR-associated helicase/endonuclease Cas3, partial [Myxococcota bacterium]|nr:type I-U CRISPR-associated helicase/endonuclease Cas3 [Myxococcota bacterium]
MPHLPDPASHLADAIGASPFPWQRRLLGELLAGRVPRALDLPTGLGKTSVMAVWLVARACRATHLPRRLVYVVDRRAVVDQATREAERLRAWATRPVIAAALGDLPISTLRGQHVDNRRWLEDPSAAAIVVGTVDMIGSRLLFEGYGCSRKLRPLQAGLLGADAWFVLDEAHLVPPFERMVEAAVGDPALRSAEAVIPPARVLSLSATGRDHGEATFRLDQDDARHEVVARRLNARKRLTIERLDAGVKLPEQLAARVAALLDGAPDPVRVVVFCNLRDDAEKVKALLDRGPRPDRLRQARTELFVGARRVRERTEAEAALRELGFLAGSPRPAVDAVLVATSAAEVGVDLDADHLVGDVVAWERLVQRLGRVNRRGEGDAQVTLLAAADDPWVDRVEALVNRLPELAGGGRSASPAALRSIGDPRAIAAA